MVQDIEVRFIEHHPLPFLGNHHTLDYLILSAGVFSGVAFLVSIQDPGLDKKLWLMEA